MKKTKNILSKWLLMGLFAFVLSLTSEAQIYGINVEPQCWRIGSVDSTIYVAWLNAPNTTKPSRLHYFNVSGLAVNVTGGTLYPGACNGGGVACAVTNEWRVETITAASTSYATNTYNSIAIEAVSGTVTVSVDGGTAVALAVGTILTVRADACKYVQSSMVVAITSGSAIVSRYF